MQDIKNILNENEFRSFICSLLETCGFKINIIVEGAGSDGGRDLEVTSFEYDTATREKECINWWVELKFRSQQKATSNLGINDLSDISSKIIRASNKGIDKFLLVTNGKLSKELFDHLIIVSKRNRIPLKIWDKDKINNIVMSFNEFNTNSKIVKIADRNLEATALINIINSNYKNIIQITGKRGVGKSLLANYIAKHLSYTAGYGYGFIDCKNHTQIGLQIKEIANSLCDQNIYSEFVDTISLNKSENERTLLLCNHIQKNRTILIIDNIEYILDKCRRISSPQVETLINFSINNSINDSIIFITSQLSLNTFYSSQTTYVNFELKGWDIDYILDSYIPTLSYISKQLSNYKLSREEQKELFLCLEGNPFALNILNQLCEKNDLLSLIEKIKLIDNIPHYLLEQLSGSLSDIQVLSLEKISQFSRTLDEEEITHFICNKSTLDSLIFRGLLEHSSMLKNKYTLHPLTIAEFSLNNNIDKKRKIVDQLTSTIKKYIINYHIDELYPHNLMRQIIDMNISIRNFSEVAETLIIIGTRILATGDIYYLNSIMEKLASIELPALLDVRLMKLKAHIASYSDRLFESKKIYEEMLERSIELNDPWSKSAALNGLGSMARYVNDYKTAIDYYVESASIRESNNMIAELSNSLHNIGATYIISKNYKKAIDVLKKACDIRLSTNDQFRLSASMLYLGESYTLTGEFENAEETIKKCKEIKENIKDIVGTIWCCCGLAKLYIISDETQKLISFESELLQNEKLAHSLKMTRHYALLNIYLGILSFYKKEYTTSIGYYNASISLCQDFRKDLFEKDIRTLTLLSLNFKVNESDKEIIKEIVKGHKI